MVVLFVFGEIISPGFLSFSHLMSVLRLSVFLGVVALGQGLVVMAGGEGIDLSVGSVVSLGVVIASSLVLGKDADIPAAFAAAVSGGFAIGLVNGIGVSYVGIPPLIMTLAMSNVVEGLSLLYTQGYPTGTRIPCPGEPSAAGASRDPQHAPALDRADRGSHPALVPQAVGRHALRRGRKQRYRGAVRHQRETVPDVRLWHLRRHLGIRRPHDPGLHRHPVPEPRRAVPDVLHRSRGRGGIALAGGSGSYIGAVIGCILLTTLSSILVALQTTEAIRQIVYGGAAVRHRRRLHAAAEGVGRMKIGIFTALFGDWPLEKVARYVAGLGYEAVELPLWDGNGHVSLKDLLGGGAKTVKKMLSDNGLSISALNHGVAGQLSMGPHDSSTDAWRRG